MSTEPYDDALRCLASSASLRFTALYGTDADSATRRSRRADARPAADLFAVSRDRPSYHEWMRAAADQLPTVVDMRRAPGHQVNLEAAAPLVTVASCWTWTFDVGEAGFVLAITLDVIFSEGVDAGDALSALFDDFDTHRRSRRVEGRPLGSRAGLELGFDFHAVVAMPDAQRNELTPEIVQALVSRSWHLSLPRFVSASLHDQFDGFPDGVVAVTPGASVVCGIGNDGAMAAIVCAGQATSAVATLRDLQRDAYRMAVRVARGGGSVALGEDGVSLPEELEATAKELADHELDLSLAVERFAEMRIFVPVWRIEQYHKLLLEALGVERATEVTATMLKRVSAAVSARRAVIDSRRWRQAERRRRSLSAVGGAAAFIAIPLTIVFGFLSIGVRPVGPDGSALRAELLPYYAALLGLLAIAASAGRWYVRRDPDALLDSAESRSPPAD